MTTYAVERTTEGREVYLVEADTPEEARDAWMKGDLEVSEVLSSDHYKVTEHDS